MNEHIMQWSSDAMYDGRLVADSKVRERTIKDIVKIEDELTMNPLMIIDTAGALIHEAVESDKEATGKKASMS